MNNSFLSFASSIGLSVESLIALLGVGVIALFILMLWAVTPPTDKKKSRLAEKADNDQQSDKEALAKSLDQSQLALKSWGDRLQDGLAKTREGVWSKVASVFSKEHISEEDYESLEEVLFTSDMPPALVDEILEALKASAKIDADSRTPQALLKVAKKQIAAHMDPIQSKLDTSLFSWEGGQSTAPKVIMIVGVNGAGKTTTIGKLATKLKSQGASVVVGACDTFRAAAVEQLEVWAKRADVELVKASEGADPSGVAFDTVKRAVEMQADYCIVDTAGRLHTKTSLMDELAKTKKVMSKVLASAPHHTLLVIDAITGQNALRQAQEFNKALGLTGLIFTKCDGSSKAGSAVGITKELQVPIAYIGVGEQVEDLERFELKEYLNALLGVN